MLKHTMNRPLLLGGALFLVLASPLSVAAQDAAESPSAPDSTSETKPGDEGAAVGSGESESAETATESSDKPVATDPNSPLDGEEAAAKSRDDVPEVSLKAADYVQRALDGLAAAQALVIASEDGQEEADRVELAREIVAARRSLEQALVSIGKLEGAGDLRSLLEESGLILTEGAKAAILAEEELKRGLSAERFQQVVAAITSVSFSEGRMQELRGELAGERLTASQAWALVELFDFSRDRVEALVLLHPQIIDPENFGALLAGLKFESDRETVRSRLGLDG
jgi:hypothetical protein